MSRNSNKNPYTAQKRFTGGSILGLIALLATRYSNRVLLGSLKGNFLL